MNRAARRKMVRKFPGYRKALKAAANDAVKGFENMIKENWVNDETLNEGAVVDDGERNFGEDEIYND